MSIKILPARLANQIAAGEVVERPASVVKELLENSLDAGATKIEVEVVKGGHKRILVRDNGQGIVKDELTLALSRHATSKIATLEDLENIASLGFRGEALASISSVSRLILTSKTAEQKEAWQAQCEGREMEVAVTPAAHPQGTSIDVQDLFFNTPARRKFLRTEKTEFTHIDELFKRAVLSHFGVHFTLRHNDKVVRNFPAARNEASRLKRVAQICGKTFQGSAIQFSSEYQEIQFQGWLTDSQGARTQNDQQYVYINGRMMRDKLIAHAIRQAYEGLISPDNYPAYVVYLQMPTDMLDVNVHPTKQEVRFHQARLVHDFIYKTVNDALQQSMSDSFTENEGGNVVEEPASHFDSGEDVAISRESTTRHYNQLHANNPSHDYIKPLRQTHTQANTERPGQIGGGLFHSGNRGISQTASNNYQQLMQPAVKQESDLSENNTQNMTHILPVDERNMLVRWQEKFYMLATCELERLKLQQRFECQVPVAQPLLMPVAIPVESTSISLFRQHKSIFERLNIEIVEIGAKLVLRKVPAGYRQMDWAAVIVNMLKDLEASADAVMLFSENVVTSARQYQPAEQFELWHWFQNQYASGKELDIEKLFTAIRPVTLIDWLVCNE